MKHLFGNACRSPQKIFRKKIKLTMKASYLLRQVRFFLNKAPQFLAFGMSVLTTVGSNARNTPLMFLAWAMMLMLAAPNAEAQTALTVSITSPTSGQTLKAPATFMLAAATTDQGGSVTQVAYYNGSRLMGTVTHAPYSLIYSVATPGLYRITALAIDNTGAVAASAEVDITVTAANSAEPGAPMGVDHIYDIHSDQLNTPRMITDQNSNVVWQWDNVEPFGNGILNQSVNSSIVFNLRFPGQYFDQETGLHYNYFRDYDPSTGRYLESDPLGLFGGSLSTYGYVGGNPLSGIDQSGLATVNWISWANNPDLFNWADSYNPANFNTVVVHGNDAGQFSPNISGGPYYDGKTLADILRQSPNYDPHKPTLLIACQSASSRNPMQLSGAQQFANELANMDPKIKGKPDTNPVYAPTRVTSPYLISTLPPGPNGQPGEFAQVNGKTH